MSKEEAVQSIIYKLNMDPQEAEKLVDKAIVGGEIGDDEELETWLNERLLPNVVTIDEEGYGKMCVDALKILNTTAATDYGGSRQRDLGQLWADMTRGYLGELAIKLFLEKKCGITAEMGHDLGALEEYLPLDIHYIKDGATAEYRVPKLKIGIKTTKVNGIWLDIPGDQFSHSDIHILVKVGTGRDHLFAFFKHISVFKDKVLKKGVDLGALTAEESDTLYHNLPTFRNIIAYICGFIDTRDTLTELSYAGVRGRKNYTITRWNGPIHSGDLNEIKSREAVPGSVKFIGIGKFSHDSGYLFNTGNLKWRHDDWAGIIKEL
jgi:hypothetical protein